MIQPGEIISHNEMCHEERYTLQKGMNFQVLEGPSVILMSLRKGAPYADEIENNGETLIYVGHNVPKTKNLKKNPNNIDQPMKLPGGGLTQNGKFYLAAESYKKGTSPEIVKVYEKIKNGIWVYNGLFELVDSWIEKVEQEDRNVFKFKLKITDKKNSPFTEVYSDLKDLDHNRLIPPSVKLEVWKRDNGKCVECGSNINLHFDHILPFSKGGTSLRAENIQILCARHNLEKHDKIM